MHSLAGYGIPECAHVDVLWTYAAYPAFTSFSILWRLSTTSHDFTPSPIGRMSRTPGLNRISSGRMDRDMRRSGIRQRQLWFVAAAHRTAAKRETRHGGHKTVGAWRSSCAGRLVVGTNSGATRGRFEHEFSYISNVDHVRARGIEAVLSEHDVLVRGLELSSSVTYLDCTHAGDDRPRQCHRRGWRGR